MWKKKRVIYRPARRHCYVPGHKRASDEEWERINATLIEDGLGKYVHLTDEDYDAQFMDLAHQRFRDFLSREFWISFRRVGGKLISYCYFGAVTAFLFLVLFKVVEFFYLPISYGEDVALMLIYIYLGYTFIKLWLDSVLGVLYGWKYVREMRKS